MQMKNLVRKLGDTCNCFYFLHAASIFKCKQGTCTYALKISTCIGSALKWLQWFDTLCRTFEMADKYNLLLVMRYIISNNVPCIYTCTCMLTRSIIMK